MMPKCPQAGKAYVVPSHMFYSMGVAAGSKRGVLTFISKLSRCAVNLARYQMGVSPFFCVSQH
jgi:hypothetical protein